MQPDCFEKISYSSGINFANVSSMFTIQTTLHFGGGGVKSGKNRKFAHQNASFFSCFSLYKEIN